MERLDRTEAQRYWIDARTRVGSLDESEDPDLLGNVCHVGAPAWFNEYYARHQRAVFETLLAECPPPAGDARALDVGCGAARWCRLLHSHGYQVEGIDLQEQLIARNRVRYPTIRFHSCPIQDFVPDHQFDLVTTVTVVQHMPFDEQRKAIAKISSLLKPGGHVLSLENIADQSAHVFANSIEGWTKMFEEAGLTRVALRRYDYSPAIRLSSTLVNASAQLARQIGWMGTPAGPAVPRAPTAEGMEEGGRWRRAVRRAGWIARRMALSLDEQLEPMLIRLNPSLPTVHCGFLFRKPA